MNDTISAIPVVFCGNQSNLRVKNSPDLENQKIACPSKCRKAIDKLNNT
jgi:hypothetical protein